MCSATVPECSVHIETHIHLITVDYNGQRRQAGGDPIDASVCAVDENGERATTAPSVGVQVKDNDDGSYVLSFRYDLDEIRCICIAFGCRPPESRAYRLDIQIFGRPIRDSPFALVVSNHHSPVWQFGSYGVDQPHLCQPVKVCCGGIGGEQLYILDTGNNRGKLSTVTQYAYVVPTVTQYAYVVHTVTQYAYVVHTVTQCVAYRNPFFSSYIKRD